MNTYAQLGWCDVALIRIFTRCACDPFRLNLCLLQAGDVLPSAKVAPEKSTEKAGVNLLCSAAEVRDFRSFYSRAS